MDVTNVKTEIPFKAGVVPGKLIACEVRNAQGLVRRIDFNQSNMMSMRVIHRLASAGLIAGGERYMDLWAGSLASEFRYCRLGTGSAANPTDPASLLSLSAPILAWNNTQYLANDVNYNSTTSTVNSENDDIRYKWRISHQHAYATADVTITEIGYADAASPTSIQNAVINSRIVLPTPIPLEVEQYLVTIYEFSIKLPSILPTPVASMNIQGIPVTSGLCAFRAGHANANGEVVTAGIQSVNAVGILRGYASNYQLSGTNTGGSNNSGSTGSSNGNGGGGAVLSKQTSLVPIGTGRYGVTATSATAATDIAIGTETATLSTAAYNNDGIATRTFTRARDAGAPIMDVNSIFLWGFQFLLEQPFDRYQDQSISITASIKWELLQGAE
jgi:hypothetical protein